MCFFQRQSNHSSSSNSGGGYSKSTSATSPYQSQLYDSWKTEWDGAYYDQRDHFRSVHAYMVTISGVVGSK